MEAMAHRVREPTSMIEGETPGEIIVSMSQLVRSGFYIT